jgi:POT family proton-dependent oligopeptide transporter
MKMAFGLLLLSLGYVVIAFGVHGVDASTKISMWWLVSLYILHTMGELSLSPIGLSMVSKLAPVRFASLLMGTWFLGNAAANKFAGTLSALIPPGAESVLPGPITYFLLCIHRTQRRSIDNTFPDLQETGKNDARSTLI